MDLVKCKNGHLYDPEITPQCPECAKQGLENTDHYGKTMSIGGGSFDEAAPGMAFGTRPTEPADSTGPFGSFDSSWDDSGPLPYPTSEPIGKTQPLLKNTQPVNPGHGPAGMNYPGGGADPYAGTQPLRRPMPDRNPSVAPVTGWLVCVEGPGKGRDYRLHEDYNYIGRSPEMDVSIQDDMTISRERHAIIAYDDQERKFYFAPCGGASMVRQNGKVVLSTVELNAGDRLQIGRSIFCFVPFCGEAFQW